MSMSSLHSAAARDYNTTIANLKQEAVSSGVDTIVSVVKCGSGFYGEVAVEIVNSSVNALQPIKYGAYVTDGRSTPLYDSVGTLIEMLSIVPDANSKEVAFLITAITDGEENSSTRWNATRLKNEILRLQATDRWSFVFRVPRGYGQRLARVLGVYEGNVQEWDQTVRGVEVSTAASNQGFKSYYAGLRTGRTSTDRFFSDLSGLPLATVKKSLTNISHKVQVWSVPNRQDVKGFMESKLGYGRYVLGTALYELIKADDIQSNKIVVIKDKSTGAFYSGAEARDLLGLPHFGTVRVTPGNHGQYIVYVQSTSVNRILPAGSSVLYWPDVSYN